MCPLVQKWHQFVCGIERRNISPMSGSKEDNEKCLHFVGFELVFCASFISKKIFVYFAHFIVHNLLNSQSASMKENMVSFCPSRYIRLTAQKKIIFLIGMMFDLVVFVSFLIRSYVCVFDDSHHAKCGMYPLSIMDGQRLRTIFSDSNVFPLPKYHNHMFLTEMANTQTNVRIKTIFLRLFANCYVMSLRVHLGSIAFNVSSNVLVYSKHTIFQLLFQCPQFPI